MKKYLIVPVIALAACSGSPERPPPPEPLADARAMHELAAEAFDAGRYRDAIAGFRDAERRFLSVDDPHGIAVAAISQAEIQLLLGENDDASRSLQRARTAASRTGNSRLRERAQLLQARLAMNGDTATARQILNGLSATTTPSIAAQVRLLSCELEMRRGETECAAGLVADDARTAARIAHLQARAALDRGDEDAAGLLLERALTNYRALAFRPGIAAVHEAKAALARRSGNHESAREHLERALYLRLWIRDRVHSAEVLAQLAELANGDAMRERYRRWRAVLLDESAEPDWEEMMAPLFSSR